MTGHQEKAEVFSQQAVESIAAKKRVEAKVRSKPWPSQVTEVQAGLVCHSQQRNRAQMMSGSGAEEDEMALAVIEP